MTRQAMEDMIFQNIAQQLQNQHDIYTRINKAFTDWFQGLVEPPQPVGPGPDGLVPASSAPPGGNAGGQPADAGGGQAPPPAGGGV